MAHGYARQDVVGQVRGGVGHAARAAGGAEAAALASEGDQVVACWMPESGFQPDDRLCYERFQGGPEDGCEGKHAVDICVPVKPL